MTEVLKSRTGEELDRIVAEHSSRSQAAAIERATADQSKIDEKNRDLDQDGIVA